LEASGLHELAAVFQNILRDIIDRLSSLKSHISVCRGKVIDVEPARNEKSGQRKTEEIRKMK
jgi:hypothetical protein